MHNLNKLFLSFLLIISFLIASPIEAKRKKLKLPILLDNEEMSFDFDKKHKKYMFKTLHDGRANANFI